MQKLLLALVAAGVLLAAPAAARPGPSQDEQGAVADLVAQASQRAGAGAGKEYKNTQPLIGILTQPCSDCPGR